MGWTGVSVLDVLYGLDEVGAGCGWQGVATGAFALRTRVRAFEPSDQASMTEHHTVGFGRCG